MKKFQTAMLLILLSVTAFAQPTQTLRFVNEPGNPSLFCVTGDSIIFSSIHQDICGPESACQGDLVTSPNPACPGQWVTVTANPTQGAWPYTFLWSNGATTQQQVLQFWSQSDLWVQVTDATGCSWFAQGTVFMNTNGVTPAISGSLQFCSGAFTTLTASGGSQVTWTGPNGFTASTASITVNQPGMYAATVSNGGGCSGTASINVTMSPAPVVSIAGPAGFCPNSNATLTASSSVPGSNFSWNTGQSGPVLTTSTSGTYTVTATTLGGCSATTSKTIVAFPAPSPKIKVSYANNIASLSVLPGLNAVWSTGASTSSITNVPNGTYAVTVTDQQTGCVATSTPVELDLAPCAPPCPVPVANFTFAPSPQNPQVIIFTNTTNTGGSPTTYAWNFGDNSNSMDENPTHVFQPGTYQVTLVATNACGASIPFTLNVTIACPPPTANFTFVANGATVNFTSTSTGNGLTYAWDFGDGATSTLANPSHTYASSGNYTVTLKVTNSCGAQNTIQKFVNVTVCVQPDAQFNLPQSGGLDLQFTNTSTGSNPMNYWWTFGDTSPGSSEKHPSHHFPHSGVFNITLEVSDACGNVDQCVKTLTVLNSPTPTTEPSNGGIEFRAYPTVTPSQFWIEGAPGMYILTDPQGRSKKLIKTE